MLSLKKPDNITLIGPQYSYFDRPLGYPNVLVNTVNTCGVMGKGLALEFRKRYPEMFHYYKRACMDGSLRPGQVLPWVESRGGDIILNAATKKHWSDPSLMCWIADCLQGIVWALIAFEAKVVHIPALGCGNGGLSFDEVYPLMLDKLKVLGQHRIAIFPPQASR